VSGSKGITLFMTISSKKMKPVHAGLSISHHTVELVIFSPKTLSIEQSYALPLPDGLFDPEMDTVRDVTFLKEQIAQLFAMARPRPMLVHLSLPATLLRLVEMPKMEASALYLSLSCEAERYKTFDNTEASVDFVLVPNPALPANVQQLILGAVRSDVLGIYLKILKELKVKPASVSLEPVNILRGLAASGVLDSLVQQIGSDASWGMILVEAGRVRFSLWHANRIMEFRELIMDTSEFKSASFNTLVVEDLLEEMRRTTKNEVPTLWLTSNMPVEMEQVLSERLRIPVRSAPLGNSIAMANPVSLAGLGTAATSFVMFPFELDILEGVKATGGLAVAGSDSHAKVDVSDSGTADLFIPIGAMGLVLCSITTGILFAMGMISGQGLPEIQSKLDSAKNEVAVLQGREKILRSKANLNQDLQNVLKQAKAKTSVYVALTDELKEKTPTDQVWIQSLKIDSQGGSNPMEVEGKALNHQSVINFARSFDDVPYTKAVLIDAIKEGKISGNLVYDFKLSGSINLDPMLSKSDSNHSGVDNNGSSPEATTTKSGA